jgi:hypothetical protein
MYLNSTSPTSDGRMECQPLYCALAVYDTPSGVVLARAYLSSNLSRSFEPIEMSARKGIMSSRFQRARTRKRSAKRAAGSVGKVDDGKYVSSNVEERDSEE